MEEHPIPQNVTDFEFHLVGDMTLKQFGYLAGGLVTAYLIFVILAKTAPLIAYPLIVFFSLTGTAFAFLPIQHRPLDHWLSAFLKAIFQPTQRKYQSALLKVDDPFFKKRLGIYLNSTKLPDIPLIQDNLAQATVPVQETAPPPLSQPLIKNIPTINPIQPTPVAILPKQNIPNPFPSIQTSPKPPIPPINQTPKLPESEDLKKTVDLAKEAQIIQTKISQTEREINIIRAEAATPGADRNKSNQKFQSVIKNLQNLNQQAQQVSKELAEVAQDNPKPPPSAPVKAKSTPSISLTSTPNIINGIVTDSLGSYVEGAIVVAHDKQGLPVRALKTNKLGQFIAATPLPLGIYTLNVEKDNLIFDVIEVELKDTILNPVVISAKKAERIIG